MRSVPGPTQRFGREFADVASVAACEPAELPDAVSRQHVGKRRIGQMVALEQITTDGVERAEEQVSLRPYAERFLEAPQQGAAARDSGRNSSAPACELPP